MNTVFNTNSALNETSNMGTLEGSVPTIVATTPVVTIPTNSVPHGEKSGELIVVDFKRCQQKMFFYLTTLNLAKFLNEDASVMQKGENNRGTAYCVRCLQAFRFLVQKLHSEWVGQCITQHI